MKVLKTVKLYIGGKFPRTESGRSYPISYFNSEKTYARVCQSSRKDFRNAVEAAKSGEKAWSSRTAFNRSQILYRMAEMLEGKREEFETLFQETLGHDKKEAKSCVDAGRDAFVYYAGFCDKFQQVTGSVNNVNCSYHNFSTPEAVGVVSLIESDKFNFEKLCASLASILVGGNSVVALLGAGCPAVLAPLAEVFATSDLPAGVINLLTGDVHELYEFIAGHREVRSINYQHDDKKILAVLKRKGAENMKRFSVAPKDILSLEAIQNHIEIKTVWHPIGV